MKHIYQKQEGSEMRVAVFFSGGASSVQAMLKDPNYRTLYEIVVGFTNEDECAGMAAAEEAGIPVVHRNFKTFCQEKGIDPKDFAQRAVYYEAVINDLKPYAPDIVCLSGFTGPGSIIVDPFLTEYADRIINVHPADLAILASKEEADFNVSRLCAGNLLTRQVTLLVGENNLERRYKGEDAVYDAIISGEEYTRSSVHIARKVFDEGPLLVQSKKFPVRKEWVRAKTAQKNFRALRKYADDLQETMKWEGDGPAYLKTLELIARGKMAIDGDTVFVDGQELPYMGFGLD
jgi:folate-dependent phosphoribosylglycinamide formyltransferase PurN